jgi:hypothetical protein
MSDQTTRRSSDRVLLSRKTVYPLGDQRDKATVDRASTKRIFINTPGVLHSLCHLITGFAGGEHRPIGHRTFTGSATGLFAHSIPMKFRSRRNQRPRSDPSRGRVILRVTRWRQIQRSPNGQPGIPRRPNYRARALVVAAEPAMHIIGARHRGTNARGRFTQAPPCPGLSSRECEDSR